MKKLFKKDKDSSVAALITLNGVLYTLTLFHLSPPWLHTVLSFSSSLLWLFTAGVLMVRDYQRKNRPSVFSLGYLAIIILILYALIRSFL